MKLMLLWARLPSYLAGFCRAMEAMYGHEVIVAGIGNDNLGEGESPVSDRLFEGIRRLEMTEQTANDAEAVAELVARVSPDVLMISGWQYKGYAKLYSNRDLGDLPIVLCADNTFRGTWKQFVGKFALRSFFSRSARVWVPGKAGRELMGYWNVPESKVLVGLYNVDSERIHQFEAGAHEKCDPPSFLFAGQLIQRKGFDLLCEAYSRYRRQVDSPWALTVCGRGPLDHLCQADGIDFKGFVDGSELPAYFYRSDVFVLPSVYDAWGVVLAEAACCGMPLIGTTTCGATADLIVDHDNGLAIEPGSSDAILEAMLWFHETGVVRRKEMGKRSQELCDPHTAAFVAHRMDEELRLLIPAQ
ncbi:GDP-mannose-dependent alpha-(1-6)-phosphatidylinositol monomannoside mannosyltransferase [Stieleria neptunia]|uniref:GDP-mannose-dependent alpha-(1-6)-phosphatidylinositol monomannoside mannosyltransferase n=1 Tax=Stieleria neptunia TaxID=2527979 RepID=A0A518HTL8_9BACT|nr:glycosyltransferase family 4 protein [Stieleria neptunia]QDV44199.1 GDP-mannose-dependent alpha-(1-6)-phosphatidylinositol monomannoside mannosyltransferase [Stieleria neptunia]